MRKLILLVIPIIIASISYSLWRMAEKPEVDDVVYIPDYIPLVEVFYTYGGTVEEYAKDSAVTPLYEDYLVQYNRGEIGYDEFLGYVEYVLTHNAEIYPRLLPTMISRYMTDASSKYRFYLQDNIERTASTIFVVECASPLNTVTVIPYDRRIFELVDEDGQLKIWFEGDVYEPLNFYRD